MELMNNTQTEEEKKLGAVPCRTCGELPIFPFAPRFIRKSPEIVALEYHIYSRCGCIIAHVQTIITFDEPKIITTEDFAPTIEKWNKFNER